MAESSEGLLMFLGKNVIMGSITKLTIKFFKYSHLYNFCTIGTVPVKKKKKHLQLSKKKGIYQSTPARNDPKKDYSFDKYLH